MPAPAPEMARRVLEAATPYAREMGSEGALEEIERILREGNGADARSADCALSALRGAGPACDR
jgi:carboxylate-amine ligase